MQHRIRPAAIIVQGDSLLLVKHQSLETGEVWWMPPGGGIEGKESLFECARRETFEESGVSVDLDKSVYLRQFIALALELHHREVFILAKAFSGTPTIANINGKGLDEEYIKDARFLSKEETRKVTVYPEILKDAFWEDLQQGFPATKYLGVQIGSMS